MNDVLEKVADTVTNEPVIITVDIKPQGWFNRLLRRTYMVPTVKIFSITLITAGNLFRISKLLNEIDTTLYNSDNKSNFLDSNFQLIEKHIGSLSEIVAIGLHNKKDGPPKSLIRFVETNFTAIEILNVLFIIIKQMDVGSFMTTIISVKGINTLPKRTASVTNVNGAGVSL